MSTKRETVFYTGVNKKLPSIVYALKMYNPFVGGIPDCYYENRLNLFVEYKFVALPSRDTTVIDFDLSALQKDWLLRNYENGHAPRVIIGTKVGVKPMGVILESPPEWESGMPCGAFRKLLMTQQALADTITRIVTCGSTSAS